MLLRALIVISSAALTAAVFILTWRHGADLPLVSAAAFGATAPMAGVALAFPAIYLLWEQSEL